MPFVMEDEIDVEHTGSGIEINFKIFWYQTLNELLEVYRNGDADALYVNQSDMTDDDIRELASDIGSWGFCLHGIREIHAWVSTNHNNTQMITTLAHEIGHCIPPFHRLDDLEEQKASKYEGVTYAALQALKQKRECDNLNDPCMNGQVR